MLRNVNMLGMRRTEECLLDGTVSGMHKDGRVGVACERKCCGRKHEMVKKDYT